MEARSRGLVRVAGTVLERSILETEPATWHRLLQLAQRRSQQPECLCWGADKPMPLSIARHGDSLILRRMPMSGPTHHAMCASHGGIEPSRSRTSAGAEPIRSKAGGGVDIRLDVAMSSFKGTVSQSPQERGEATKASTARPGLSLTGLMQLVWDRAGLNYYVPANGPPLRLGQVYAKVVEEMAEMAIGGVPVLDRVFVPTTRLDAESMANKVQDLTHRYEQLQAQAAENERPIMLIMAEARRFITSKYGFALLLKGMPNTCPIWLSHAAMERLSADAPDQVKTLFEGSADGDWRMWCLAGIQMSSKGAFNWTYGSLMETTVEYIPVQNRHEAALAAAMVRQGRTFLKPLRYTSEDEMHPDFMLLDATPPVAMEVFSMDTPEYLERKELRLRTYVQKDQRVWTWNAHKERRMPAFPIDRN